MFRRDLLFLNFLIFDWLAASRARDSFRANIPWLFESSPPAASFDKEYNERTGQLYFKDTHIAEMLRLGRSQVEVSIRTVMMTDSLEMTDADRNLIVQNCLQSAEDRIVITHGTDTMTEHRGRGGWRCHRENSRANRSDDPLRLWQFRRPLQSGQRALVRAGTASRSLHCHTRSMLSLGPRPENRERGEFEEIPQG